MTINIQPVEIDGKFWIWRQPTQAASDDGSTVARYPDADTADDRVRKQMRYESAPQSRTPSGGSDHGRNRGFTRSSDPHRR